MPEIRVLVLGENCSNQLKKFSERFKSFNESNYLFDGVLTRSDLSPQEVSQAILANPKLIPHAVIDNGQWFDAKRLGQKTESWQKTLGSLIEQSSSQGISCFTCQVA